MFDAEHRSLAKTPIDVSWGWFKIRFFLKLSKQNKIKLYKLGKQIITKFVKPGAIVSLEERLKINSKILENKLEPRGKF